MLLCEYSNVLGEPGKGVHSYKIRNIAVVDLMLTIIGGYLISYVFNASLAYSFAVIFSIGIVFHRIFPTLFEKAR